MKKIILTDLGALLLDSKKSLTTKQLDEISNDLSNQIILSCEALYNLTHNLIIAREEGQTEKASELTKQLKTRTQNFFKLFGHKEDDNGKKSPLHLLSTQDLVILGDLYGYSRATKQALKTYKNIMLLQIKSLICGEGLERKDLETLKKEYSESLKEKAEKAKTTKKEKAEKVEAEKAEKDELIEKELANFKAEVEKEKAEKAAKILSLINAISGSENDSIKAELIKELNLA